MDQTMSIPEPLQHIRAALSATALVYIATGRLMSSFCTRLS